MRIELEAPQQKIIYSKKIEHKDFPCSPMVKNQPCNAGDWSLVGELKSHVLQSN